MVNAKHYYTLGEFIMSRKLLIKVIGIVILAISIVILCFAGMKHSEQSEKSERALTLQLHISPIMYSYGLTNYTVKYYDYAYEVFAEGFEYLTNAEALSLLKELDNVSCNDPCGDGKIDFGGMANVHPGLNVDYSYWRVSSYLVTFNKMHNGGYTKAGIYCNKGGRNMCVYECES